VNPPLGILHALNKNRLTTGSAVQMMEAAREQRQRGHQVTVAAPPKGDMEDACHQSGVDFLPLPFRHEIDVVSISGLRRLFRSGCDIAHVHKGLPLSLVLVAAAGLGHRPRVVTNRGVSFSLDIFNRWKYRHPRVDVVVCVAEAVREVIMASAGVRREKTRVIYAGTDTSRFCPARHRGDTIRRELGLSSSTLLIGSVSVRGWKGWRELIEAFARLKSSGLDAHLLLVGCEPDSERLKVENEAASLNLAERVLPLGFRSDMRDVLGACDIVVDASWEGTGITGTIREAMAMAKPVVATDVGGNSELISRPGVGRLVPPRNVERLTKVLVELAGAPELRSTIGKAARRRVCERFSTEKRVDELLTLYDELVSGEARSCTLDPSNPTKGA
jgi:glycosyltransferase involved in cell wall biosynthesis